MLISQKDKFLENIDKYIAVLYISSNTGRNLNSEVRKSGWNVIQKSQIRWETNLSIVGLVKSELNSVFKRFLVILKSVINYCKISQNIVLFWVQIG